MNYMVFLACRTAIQHHALCRGRRLHLCRAVLQFHQLQALAAQGVPWGWLLGIGWPSCFGLQNCRIKIILRMGDSMGFMVNPVCRSWPALIGCGKQGQDGARWGAACTSKAKPAELIEGQRADWIGKSCILRSKWTRGPARKAITRRLCGACSTVPMSGCGRNAGHAVGGVPGAGFWGMACRLG